MDVAWLSDRSQNDELSFVMVLQEGIPSSLPGAEPQKPLGPISHLGFGLESREAVAPYVPQPVRGLFMCHS
jgi:hypothetical protein